MPDERIEAPTGNRFWTQREPGQDYKADLLIVDDQPANLRLLSAILTEHGYKVRSAINGELALAASQAVPPDLILLDVKMPEMNGYQVCEGLKAAPKTRDVPVIFISALDETQDKVRAFTAGGVDYVTKPFQIEEVLARVETHLTLRRLQRELQETNRRLTDELLLASTVQAGFLPRELPAPLGWQLTATLRPAREMSGDFFDVIRLPEGRLGLVIADVTDKGTAAALFMALCCTLLRTYAVEYPACPDLVFKAVHQRIQSDTDTKQFVTAFYAVLDPQTGSLTFSNAGHNPPYLLNPHDAETVRELSNTGLPLGLRLFTDMEWETRTVTLAPGDVLVLYTDGVTEAQNSSQELYGEERLLALVRDQAEATARAMQQAILAAVETFRADAPQVDDIAMMVLARA